MLEGAGGFFYDTAKKMTAEMVTAKVIKTDVSGCIYNTKHKTIETMMKDP